MGSGELLVGQAEGELGHPLFRVGRPVHGDLAGVARGAVPVGVDPPGQRHLGSWLRTLAGICLAATLIGGSVMVTGGITTGAHARTFAAAPSEPYPLPPIGVTVKATASIFQLKASPDDKQVHLTWQPQAPAQGFVIYDWPVQDSSKVAMVDTASGSDYLVKGLTNGTTYCFVIVRGQLAHPVRPRPAAQPRHPPPRQG